MAEVLACRAIRLLRCRRPAVLEVAGVEPDPSRRTYRRDTPNRETSLTTSQRPLVRPELLYHDLCAFEQHAPARSESPYADFAFH